MKPNHVEHTTFGEDRRDLQDITFYKCTFIRGYTNVVDCIFRECRFIEENITVVNSFLSHCDFVNSKIVLTGNSMLRGSDVRHTLVYHDSKLGKIRFYSTFSDENDSVTMIANTLYHSPIPAPVQSVR